MLRLSNRQARLLSAEDIDRAITESDDMTKAARSLGISSTRLYRLCQAHGIRKSERQSCHVRAVATYNYSYAIAFERLCGCSASWYIL